MNRSPKLIYRFTLLAGALALAYFTFQQTPVATRPVRRLGNLEPVILEPVTTQLAATTTQQTTVNPSSSSAPQAGATQPAKPALSSGTPPKPLHSPAQEAWLLAIRNFYTGGRYDFAANYNGSATNAYGAYFLPLEFWSNYANYARPDLAPPNIQDEFMLSYGKRWGLSRHHKICLLKTGISEYPPE